MRKINVRYLIEKRQSGGHSLYYWQPNKVLRKAGFLPRRLAERTNNLTDAIVEAEALNAEVDAWRNGDSEDGVQPGTMPHIVRLYWKDPRYTELAPKTQKSYDQNIKVIWEWSGRAGHPPITEIERKHVKNFYHSMMETPAKAKAVITMLRILLAFAVDEGELASNPAAKMRLKGSPPRQAVWSDNQIDAYCAEATAYGHPSIALAVLLGAHLGQRQGDILSLTWNQYDGSSISLKQGKTGVLIEVPVVGKLKEALDTTKRISPNILVSEATNRPYTQDNFRAVFRKIRDRVGMGDIMFMDLRRTAVVRLAEAGCEVPEIAAITGHSLARSAAILEVYLPRNSKMARNAIAKLEEYRGRTKLEV